MKERTPAEGIERHAERLRSLSDDELLEAIEATAPLPDADDLDPAWDDGALDRAELLLAAADVIGERRLEPGIAPLFERASLGDG